ncbi:FG-GAP-like repeat-containing protein [Paenibacillus allorhizosphaerae]
MALWVTCLCFSLTARAAPAIVVLKGQGTNPLHDFGTAVGISGSNKYIEADFDGDGDTDLANRNAGNTGIQFWRNNGNATFTELTGASNPFKDVAFSAVVSNFSELYLLKGDFDGDGDVDVFNVSHEGVPALYRNDGGSFTVLQGAGVNPLHAFGTALGGGSFKAIAADLDGDGDTDLVNRNTTSTGLQYWQNKGDGTFTPLSGASNPLSTVTFSSNINYFTTLNVAAGDFDGDGDMDIFNNNHGGTPAMYRNEGSSFTVLQGDGTNPLHAFGTALGTTTGKFVAGDFNGDGLVDLINRNSLNIGIQFWKNNGDGTFSEQTGDSNPFSSVSFTANVNYFYAPFLGVGDFDGDGDTDIVNVNHGGTPALYQQGGSPLSLTGSLPVDNEASFMSSDEIVLTFDGIVANGGPGVIEIRKSNDDSLIESIPGNSSKVSGFGTNVITIQHTAELQNNTGYYMLIGRRTFFNTDGQSYMGISNPAQLNFTARVNTVQSYPVRPGIATSDSYTLLINGQNVFVEKFGDVSMARFAFEETANITVTASEAIASFEISPKSYQIQESSNGNSLSFAIDRPRTLIVSVNNLEKLLLFADGTETNVPQLQDANVINLATYLPVNRNPEEAVTDYLQQAINDTSAMNNGAGGILFVPDGKYMTTQLKLKSNVHMYLQSGAWIKAIPDSSVANYPLQNGSDSSFIFIQNASHVKISGRGIIDGNGMAMKTLNSNENIKLLRTANVTDLRIEDIYFLDSARWTLHLLYAQDVVLNHIKIVNDLRGGPDPANTSLLLPTVTNTDGVDIDASQNSTDETGIQTVTKWNPLGWKISTGIVGGGTVSYGYDIYGRMTSTTNALNHTTSYEYDHWNRLIATNYPDSGVARIAYDDIAHTQTATDPEGNQTKETYDLLNRVSKKEWLKPTGAITLGSLAYDYAGNLLTSTDGRNNLTTYTYGVFGRLLSLKDAKNNITNYSYNYADKLTQIQYPDLKVLQKQYDELGRQIRKIDPTGSAEKYYYDASGNLATYVDRKNQTITNVYNSRNWLTQNASAQETISYEYDAAGRRTQMTDLTGVTMYLYNTLGQLQTVTYPDNKSISYAYDLQGNRTQMTDPFGNPTVYGYDAKNRLSNVGPFWNDWDVSYTYKKNDLLSGSTLRSNISNTYTYDGANLTALSYIRAGNTLNPFAYSYGYDNNANQMSKTENGASYTFSYDPINRIETSSQFDEQYTYDVRGNRQSLQSDNVLVINSGANYTYDDRNRLTQVTIGDGRTITYIYNGDGLLYERTENGQTTRYYYDGANMIAEGNVSGGGSNLKSRYVRGAGLVARVDAGGMKTYYMTNGHGDIVGLTDSNGNILNQYSYDIWGNPLATQEQVQQPFRYSGEFWDNSTNLQYLRARWYDPSVGRFISEDTYEGDRINPLSLDTSSLLLI